MLREIIITGLGRVGPQGRGRSHLSFALREAHSVPTDRFSDLTIPSVEDHRDGSSVASDFFAPIAISQLDLSCDPAPRAIQLATEASKLARSEAELISNDLPTELWIATAFGLSHGYSLKHQEWPDDLQDRWLQATGTDRIGGVVTSREASGLVALAAAAESIEADRAVRALVIEVDTITPQVLRVHRGLRALAPSHHGVPPVARPFDRCRYGTVLAEGATAIVLERESVAADRAVRGRSRLTWSYQAIDDTAAPYGFGSKGTHLGSEVAEELQEAGISPHSIGGVISGARGSIEGDAQEADWIASLFGEDAHPPVFAPIGTTGLGGGGFLAAVCLAAEGEPLGGSAGHCECDPRLPIRPHPTAVSPTPGRILASTIASGGEAAWVILDAP